MSALDRTRKTSLLILLDILFFLDGKLLLPLFF